MNVRKSDWVVTKLDEVRILGFVTRVSRDKKWADVKWTDRGLQWTKRMPVESLRVVTTIPVNLGGTELEVTDLTREKEVGS